MQLQVARETAPEKQGYLADYEAFAAGVAAQDPAWLRQLRSAAVARFEELSFPTTKDEDWKYTSVAPIVEARFRTTPAPDNVNNQPSGQTLPPYVSLSPGEGESIRLVFVDGWYAPGLSAVPSGGGVTVANLAEAAQTAPAVVQRYLTQLAPYEHNTFTALNTAFVHDGAFVRVGGGTLVEEPIHVLFISTSSEEHVVHPRALIVLAAGATATVVESYVSPGEQRYFTNTVTEAFVGEDAVLSHYKILQESATAFHIGRTHIRQDRNSLFTSFSVALGARLGRNDLNVLLDAEGAECSLNGLYLASGSDHIDNHTAIDHAQPHGTSRQRYKGILDGRARAVFNGKIVVRPGAQKTDAQQTNRNLLLSTEASVDTKPQLEIFADDVKCTHGAAVGQIDENMAFYLKSRGLSQETARRLLTYGFASEVIDAMKVEPIREHLHGILMARLGA